MRLTNPLDTVISELRFLAPKRYRKRRAIITLIYQFRILLLKQITHRVTVSFNTGM